MKKFVLISFLFFDSLFSNIDLGQRFIFALPNTTSKEKLKVWLSETKPAGVMLQSVHFESREKIKELTDFLQKEAQKIKIPKLFIAIDWEGGIVSRPTELGGFFSIPSPKNLGLAGRTYCFLAGKLIGQQLRSVGVNMNLAPSLDLFNKDCVVLGSRTFSGNPYLVFKYAQAFANGLKSEKIIPVFKHFPGLGLGKNDSHFSKVNICFDNKTLSANIYPFVKILKKEKNPFLMVSHARYPSLFGNEPATLSKRTTDWIKKRNKNCFFVTDDFCMQAVKVKNELAEVVMDSFSAGYDLIIFSPKQGEEARLLETLQQRFNNWTEHEKTIFVARSAIINNFKHKKMGKKDKKFDLSEKKISKILAQRSIKNFYPILNSEKNILLTLDLEKLRSSEKWFLFQGKSYLGKKLEKLKVKLEEFIFDPKDPKCFEKFRKCYKEINLNDKNLIVQTFFYGSGNWNYNQENLLKKLKNESKNLYVVSLGHPYEKNILETDKIYEAGSFSKPIIKEIAKRLVHKDIPKNDFSFNKLKGFLQNKKIGLLCHNASRFNINNKTIFLPDLIYNFAKNQKDDTKLVSLFSPEHGLFGDKGAAEFIENKNLSKWNCPIYSLHGEIKKPTREMLKNLDLLVVDFHEVGIRPFTYLSTLDLMIMSAAENNVDVLVLNHPNPIYFWHKSGPFLAEGFKSFVGRVDIPFMHGQSIGDIAKNLAKKYNAKVFVLPTIPKKNWKYFFRYNEYFAPSPNLTTLESVYAYPITVFLEGTNYSEGRGTIYPFQQIGAPWVDHKKLAKRLNNEKLSGIYFEPIEFKPISLEEKAKNPKHENVKCYGVFLHMYDLKNIDTMKTAQVILKTLYDMYPKDSNLIKFSDKYFLDHIVGNDSLRKTLKSN